MTKVDLHGVKHADVPRILIHAIEDSWDKGSYIEVITGHSPIMRKIVFDIAKDYNLKCENGLKNGGYIWIIL